MSPPLCSRSWNCVTPIFEQRLHRLNVNLLFWGDMVRARSRIASGIGIIWLLLSESGGLGQTDENSITHHLVNGTLGQSVTLPGYTSGENILSITWDYRSSVAAKKFQLCIKTQNNPIKYNRKRMKLNMNDGSLEIQNLTESDQGLYETNSRTDQGVHEEVMVLQIYERVSTPVINISEVLTGGVCNITLHCSSERGTEPVYSWWTGDGEITADETHGLTDEGRRLALSLSPHNNNTVYNCRVRNPVSEATGSVDLTRHCPATEGDSLRNTLHTGLTIAGVVLAFISAIFCCVYWKRRSKPNEAPNTEGRSESVQYAVIGRPCNAREQPQRHLHQLDASEGEQNRGGELTTIYDEIKFNPNVDTPQTARKEGGEFNTTRLSPAT